MIAENILIEIAQENGFDTWGQYFECFRTTDAGRRVINEGILKEITGGDQIQGRELYMPSVSFTPAFDLVATTNHLFDITAQDDGTWRRIRVVPFVSIFVDGKVLESKRKERENVFLKDRYENQN